MIYLIQEETTSYMVGISTRHTIKGYYKCDSQDEVQEFCEKKTEELKGTYSEERMSKSVIYTKLDELK